MEGYILVVVYRLVEIYYRVLLKISQRYVESITTRDKCNHTTGNLYTILLYFEVLFWDISQ